MQIAKEIEKANQNNLKEVLFDLAHHYIEAGLKQKSLEYALPAAKKAKEGYANEEAIRYYELSIKLLEEKGEKGKEEWIKTNDSLIDVYLTIGRNDEAIRVGEQISLFINKKLEKARVYKNIGKAYFKKGNWKLCEINLIKGLTVLGERVPQTKGNVILSILREFIIHITPNLFPLLPIQKKPIETNEKHKEIVWIYLTLNWMYILSDTKKFLYSVLRPFNICHSNVGKSKELGMFIGMYGGACMAIPFFKKSIKYLTHSINLRRELKDEWGVAQSLQWLGYCYSWKGELKKSIETFKKSSTKFKEIGDMWELEMVYHGLALNSRYIGEYKDGRYYDWKHYEISKKNGNNYGMAEALACILDCYTEEGEFKKAEEIGLKALKISKENNIWFAYCFTNIHMGHLELERENFEKAKEYLEKAKVINEKNTFLKEYTVYLYPYLIDASIEKHNTIKKDLKKKEIKCYLKELGKDCREALLKTRSWQNHHGATLRVNGKYYSLIGKNKKAENFFLKSISQCKKINRKFELAKSLYAYGIFLSKLNYDKKAYKSWQEAYTIFYALGAKFYIKKFENLFKFQKEGKSDSIPKSFVEKLKISSLIEIGHLLSSITDIDTFLEKIMDITLEVTGAERGFLLLYPEDIIEKKSLEIVTSRNINLSDYLTNEFTLSRTVIKKVEEKCETLIVIDALEDEELKHMFSVVKYNLRSILCAPLLFRNNLIGVLYLDNRLVSGLFNAEKKKVLEAILGQITISLENARLNSKSQMIQKELNSLVNQQNRMNTETNTKECFNYFCKDYSISNREKEVLSLLLTGMDHKNIATQLFISVSTIKTHVNNTISLFSLIQTHKC